MLNSALRTLLSRRGLSLLELMIVLVVVAILGTMLLPSFGAQVEQARATTTQHLLADLRASIVERYYDDMYETLPRPVVSGRVDHPQLVFLFVNPTTLTDDWTYDPSIRRGWRGPYLSPSSGPRYQVRIDRGFTSRYGLDGDLATHDGWAQPIVLQEPAVTSGFPDAWRYARLVSAGPNGILDTPPDVLNPTAAERGDDLVQFLWVSP